MYSPKKLVVAVLMALALAGCVTTEAKPPEIAQIDYSLIMTPAGTSDMSPERVDAVLSEIEKRNTEVEDTEEWIEKSYQNLYVRRLTNVSSSEFSSYRKYLDNGAAYVIVHPSFFTFFHYPKKIRSKDPREYQKLNIVDLLLQRAPSTPQFAVLQAQERRMRDFIEFKSTDEKLIILVIPQKYRSYSGYSYRKGLDEYLRFLNEVTNLSRSVLFVESRSPNRGYLTDDDAVKLMEFLMSINAEKIYVGGGYVGRCLEDFYTLLTEEYGKEDIFVVPELSDISPRELDEQLADQLLKSDGLIDEKVATEMLREDKYKVQELIPQINNLH